MSTIAVAVAVADSQEMHIGAKSYSQEMHIALADSQEMHIAVADSQEMPRR